MQLGQPPVLALGQRPGGGVCPQQLQGGPFVVESHPAFYDVVPHPVVQGEREPAVTEAQAQLAVVSAVGLVRLEVPLGAAPLVGAHRQGGPREAGAALDRVLLVAVELRLEGPVVGQRADGERLGVGEREPGAPVQVQQFVALGEMDGVTAGRP